MSSYWFMSVLFRCIFAMSLINCIFACSCNYWLAMIRGYARVNSVMKLLMPSAVKIGYRDVWYNVTHSDLGGRPCWTI